MGAIGWGEAGRGVLYRAGEGHRDWSWGVVGRVYQQHFSFQPLVWRFLQGLSPPYVNLGCLC